MTVSSVSCCPASYVQSIQEKRRKNSWVLLSCHQFVQIRIWRWCESGSVSQTFAALSQSWELLGMLCKLWKCWNSCTKLSRDGPEHLEPLMAGVSSCHIWAVQVKRVLCALRSGALYLTDKELGTGSCWKTACVKCGLLNCCPFPATALCPSQSCHILNLQMSCTFKQNNSYLQQYGDVWCYAPWVSTGCSAPLLWVTNCFHNTWGQSMQQAWHPSWSTRGTTAWPLSDLQLKWLELNQ